MLIKFETKCARVKGLSFHPTRPWILASLHTGAIALWDYQLGNCVEKFEGHEGPVRGISFHNNQSIFVSGGDDYRIKVWNYQQRKCAFTLLGHKDYIRSTTFHPKHPWILSASDDQTIRIWNWQSRNQIGMLSGHSHYVMKADFHPNLDLVISASLDQTIRVWDISAISKRCISAKPAPNLDKNTTKGRLSVELFRDSDFETKFVLEGHDKGVNWVTFHPSLPLAISGSDDKNVKLWRMGDEKMWEVDTFRGHYNHVSSVLFHPRQPVVISVSEDKSIRIWDMTRRIPLQIFRRKHDRFWITAAHPNKNLFCAGHDSGLMVFKLEKERPVWTLHQDSLYYVKQNFLRLSDLSTGHDVSIMRLNGEGRTNYITMSYNHVEHSILLGENEPTYELCKIPVAKDALLPPDSALDWKKSSGKNAHWIGRNRFAVLHNDNHLIIKTAKNELYKKIQLPFQCINIYPAGTGMLLLQEQPSHLDGRGEKGSRLIVLYDVQLKRVIAKVHALCKIKHVVWSCDKSRVALVGNSNILLCSSKLGVFVNWTETRKVKSGAWREPSSSTEVGVFIYNTSAQLKYILTNGDTGTIRTLDVPIYIVSVRNDQIICFDREVTPRKYNVDIREIVFKLALIMADYHQVNEMIRSCKLVGQAIISYLHQKGYPEIALHFLLKQDERTRFNLALECCNLDVGLECARVLDTAPVWNKLAEMALLLGKHNMVELCYQRTRNYTKLAFLYLVTGNSDKIKKLLKTLTAQGNDASGQYWMALISGDVDFQIQMLRNSNTTSQLATVYDLGSIGCEMKVNVPPEEVKQYRRTDRNGCLYPPVPLFQQTDNWPLLTMAKSAFGNMPSFLKAKPAEDDSMFLKHVGVGEWEDCGEMYQECQVECDVKMTCEDVEDTEPACGWDDHSDLFAANSVTTLENSHADNYFLLPTKGRSVNDKWMETCRIPIVQILSGHFEFATQLLHEQIGVVNVAPFRQLFLNAFQKSHSIYTTMPNMPSLPMYPMKILHGMKEPLPQSSGIFNVNVLVNCRLKMCYELVTKGQFMEAIDAYRTLLLSIPLTLAESKGEISQAQALITLCKEYILGLQMELYRKTLSKESLENQRRSLELAAYFTHCSLDNVHLMLALRTAMNLSFKLGYFKNATGFANRLLELGPSKDLVLQARKLLKTAEGNNNTSQDELSYDDHNPFNICAKTYKPIYKGQANVKCPFCQAVYVPELAGNVCDVCVVAEVGKPVMGLRISPIQFR